MTITPGEKHLLITFSETTLSRPEIAELAEATVNVNQDVIIDLTAIKSAEESSVEQFIDALSPILDENIVILVGDEDKLEELGFLAEEFPVTPSYNEAIDFLFMLQLEKDLGIDE